MYIGLDIGTSGTKASLVDAHGKILKMHRESYNFSRTAGGLRELDAEQVWNVVKLCLEKIADPKVRTITISTLGEAIVPVGKDGVPLCGSITGTDCRGDQELEAVKDRLGAEKLVEITGQNLSTIYSVNKILWLKKQAPEIYRNCWKILTFQDYVVFRLSGEAVIDRSMASRTLLYDMKKEDWSEEFLQKLDISREKLAKVVPSGTVAGTISRGIAEELKLPETVKIVAGTHDHISNAIGCGIYRGGSCANTVGTTEGITAVLDQQPMNPENISNYQISCEPFAIPGSYNTVAWNNTSGVLLKWFVQQFVQETSREDIAKAFEQMNQSMPSEPTKLLVLPHFSGAATPYMDAGSKGAILGLTLGTSREELYKAVMEGMNLELALILGAMKKSGLDIHYMVSTGGALTPELLQIKADVLGLEIHTVKSRQSGTLGGAILGAVAIGDYGSIGEAVAQMVEEDQVYVPDEKRHCVYEKKLEIYQKIYPAIKEINWEI